MKKDGDDLTETEQHEFEKELFRLFKLGAAIQIVASKNAGEESKGWPFITFMGEDSEVDVSFCHVLETMLQRSQISVIQNMGALAFVSSVQDIMSLAIHEAMHDAFCLGLAARTMYEMDLKGLEETLDELDKLDPDA